MLDKVMFNLLSNAFKFTNDNGFIYVSVEKNTAENNVIIKVEDSGIGMSQQVADKIFEPFYQENINDRKSSGLGLSLSKELIQLHNGNINCNKQTKVKEQFLQLNFYRVTIILKKTSYYQGKQPSEKLYYDERIFLREPDETCNRYRKFCN